MTTTLVNLIPAKFVENAQTVQYTVSAPSAATVRAVIDSFVVTNTGTTAESFSCNLVSDLDTAGPDNLLIDQERIEPGESYLCPELTGEVLEDGGFISTLSTGANALVMRASGRVVTS